MALGKNVERTAKMCLRKWFEFVELNKGAAKFQGLFRMKQSIKNVEVLREKKRKVEAIIAMALGRSDLRWKKVIIAKLVVNRKKCKAKKSVLRCYRAFCAKTIARRFIERRKRRQVGIVKFMSEYRRQVLSVWWKKMVHFVIMTNDANRLQRFFGLKVQRMRVKRVKLISFSVGSVRLGLASVCVVKRWQGARKINKCVKGYLWKVKMREIRWKMMRCGEILEKTRITRERRNLVICKKRWGAMQLIWRKSYNCLNRGIRCSLARRELWRRVEQDRLIVVRLELKLEMRMGRILKTCFRTLAECVIVKMLLKLEKGLEVFKEEFANVEQEEIEPETATTTTATKILPPIKQTIALTTVDYIISKRGSLEYTIKQHSMNARINVHCKDALSASYFANKQSIERTGIMQWNSRNMTETDLLELARSTTVIVCNSPDQGQIDSLVGVLEKCFPLYTYEEEKRKFELRDEENEGNKRNDDDDDNEFLYDEREKYNRGAEEDLDENKVECQLRKLVLVGGRNSSRLHIKKLAAVICDPNSKLTSVSMSGVNLGDEGAMSFASEFSKSKTNICLKDKVRFRKLQEVSERSERALMKTRIRVSDKRASLN